MIIKKFIGKTEDEAKKKAKSELGADAVIMNVRLVKKKGFAGLLGRPSYEVTAAVEEKNEPSANGSRGYSPAGPGKINYEADEDIKIPPLPNRNINPDARAIADSIKEIKPILKEHGVLDRDSMPISNIKNITPELPPEDSAISRFQKNRKEPVENERVKAVEKKIESLQETLKESKKEPIDFKEAAEKKAAKGNLRVIKMIYNILIENEVSEKYANQILDEAEPAFSSNNNMDVILSNVYQKMVLKFGQPATLKLGEKKPKIVFFIGPTGVGKTTTIAKIASKLKIEKGKNIAFLTTDTYRIAAAEQLRTYANILSAPLSVVYSDKELKDAVAKLKGHDVILVDTAGFSHKHNEQREELKSLLGALDKKYDKEVFLLLSATTKNKDLLDIADSYKEICEYKMIFTKLDETLRYGNLLNLKLYTGADIAYTTNGQNVPEDIEEFNSQYIVKQLLGGK